MHVLPFQIAVVLLAFVAASLLALLHGSAPVVSYHIVFAMGIVPLILGAMLHFMPVLARSNGPGSIVAALPIVALIGGILLICYFAFPEIASFGQYLGAAIIVMAVASIGLWSHQLRSQAVGKLHPCFNWYLAAMICLLVALIAILAAYFIPEQRAALRLLHLHLNTLGFIGITALGTLQVLLPTVAQRFDPGAAARMRKHLKWEVAGTLIVACAAAWYHSLAWVGLVLLLIPVFGISRSWLQLYGGEIFALHGAAPALAAALCGYAVAMTLGAIHAFNYPSINPVATFIIAFLMPLVTGAISHLLPLWLRPGQQTDWHQAARKHLGFGGGVRALIFLAGGTVAGLDYWLGWYMAAFTAGVYLLQALSMFIMVRLPAIPRDN